MKPFLIAIATVLATASIVTAGCAPSTGDSTSVTLMLDWVPNTNHTGLFVAQQMGFFEDAGLEVEIVQPGEVLAEQAVAAGVADFGVSFQEYVTLARADAIPIVSIAAVIQNNSSGFASRGALNAARPADWEFLRYGSFGSPFEEPTLRELMACDNAEFEALEVVDTGFTDPLALLDSAQIDLAWIFYGWQGVQAEQMDVDLNIVMLEDWIDCIPDYYTPVIIANESMLAERPEVVRSLLEAVSRGYQFAIENPAAAASALLQAAPELDERLVMESQAWLSPRYQGEAARWGEQKRVVWLSYAQWMAEHDIIPGEIQVDEAFTNEFLP